VRCVRRSQGTVVGGARQEIEERHLICRPGRKREADVWDRPEIKIQLKINSTVTFI
jgi:hypothetical protein